MNPTTNSDPAHISLHSLTKIFNYKKQEVVALKEISLKIQKGEFLSLIGPSGCGKSTLLRIIGGLIKPTKGHLSINGTDFETSQIGFVFQDPLLLPWRTALGNVCLPLEVKKTPKQDASDIAKSLLSLVGIQDFENCLPHELSGGMQQRVGVARALATDPMILLMDEPFSALDEINRERMNRELLRIWLQTKKTIIFVTHSISDAVFLSDRVVVMSDRPGTIKDIFEIRLQRPRSGEVRFSSEFAEYCREILALLG